jgi:predicted O-methyltransferase YrrM
MVDAKHGLVLASMLRHNIIMATATSSTGLITSLLLLLCTLWLLQLVALDIEPYMAEFAAPYWAASGLAGRIRPVIGPAQESMAKLAEQGER